MDAFAGNMAMALPFNASMGLNWSDAYIGRIFPSRPPRFGIGVTAGFTTMSLAPIENLLNEFGFDDGLPSLGGLNGFPLPGMMIEGRVGGIFLPFDVGFKVGFLPSIDMDPFEVDYFLIGGDIRYALLHSRRFLPTISVGVGLTHLRGGIGAGLGGETVSFDLGALGINETLTISSDPHIALDWSTTTLDFKTQISRSLFIITPYLGFGASHGWSRVSYALDANIETGGNIAEVREALQEIGISLDEGLDRLSSEVGINGWNFRVFGGFSLNLFVFRLDITGLYSFRDNNLGTTVGLRFQL